MLNLICFSTRLSSHPYRYDPNAFSDQSRSASDVIFVTFDAIVAGELAWYNEIDTGRGLSGSEELL